MKIYFVASISGLEKYHDNYKAIVESIRHLGHNLTESTLNYTAKQVFSQSDQEIVSYYKQVLRWVATNDVLVTDATHPSLGIGHEISLALERGKAVIVLYSEGHSPHILEGIKSDKLFIRKYSRETVEEVLRETLDLASQKADSRFNFFISPRHVEYLDFIARDRKIPRSVYLRKLIEADRDRNIDAYEGSLNVSDSILTDQNTD